MKLRVGTSIVTSAVLVTVLALSGCGGNSNSKSAKAPGAKAGTTSTSKKVSIVSGRDNSGDILGETNDGSGNAASFTLKTPKNSDGDDTCKSEKEECSCEVAIEAPTCTNRVEASSRYTPNYGNDVLDYVWNHKADYQYDGKDYDPTKQMLVYGGAIIVDHTGFSSGNLKIDVKGMECGKAILHNGADTVQAGFANPGHKVFVMIKIDGMPDQWTTLSDTMDESGNFTIDLTDIDLGDGTKDVEVLLFSIKDADKAGTTGMSGANS